MTRHDLKVLGLVVSIVVVTGLAIGYGIGLLTRGGAVGAPPPPGSMVAFDGPTTEDASGRTGAAVPGYGNIYVNDYADLLDNAAERRIRGDIEELYQRTGIELTVLTIGSMRDYGHPGPIEEFATTLFNTWGIGDATRNDGVLILVSHWDRRMRIELGAGYGTTRNGDMQRVIDTAFLPAFRRDAYQEGIERGVDETIREIAGSYPGEYEIGTVARGYSWLGRQLERIGEWALGLLAIPAGGIAIWVRRYLRRRPRPCPDCGTTMLRAGEEADDEHLDGGQRLEEYLRSVDYDVWHCPTCAHMEIKGYRGWFSGHSVCPNCDYRTMHSTSEVLTAATRQSTGTKRITYTCAHCDHSYKELRTIPKISDSSSSGSGRSSFGGGSSSGGGASGSW